MRRWRDVTHIAAVVVGAATLVGHLWAVATQDTPWSGTQQRMARRWAQGTRELTAEALKTRIRERPALAWQLGLIGWWMVGMIIATGIVGWRAIGRLRRGAPFLPAQPEAVSKIPWGLWDVAKLFGWLLCAAQLVQGLELLIARAVVGHGVRLDRGVAATVNTLVLEGVALMLVIGIILRPYRLDVRSLGVRLEHIGRAIRSGLTAYVLWVPCFMTTVVVVMGAFRWLGFEPQPQSVVVMLMEESRPTLLLTLMGMVAITGPIAEEFLFRGVAYPALRHRLGMTGGLVVSGGLFAILHADVFALIPIWVLGSFLAWVYEQTGSLVPSMTVHIVHNSTMLMIALTLRDLLPAGAS